MFYRSIVTGIAFSLWAIRCDGSCKFFVTVLFQVPFSSHFLGMFMMNGYGILSSALHACIRMIMIFFFSKYDKIHRLVFKNLNQLWMPEKNSTCSKCIILFMHCWIQFANMLLKLLRLYSFSFLVKNLSDFGNRVTLAS